MLRRFCTALATTAIAVGGGLPARAIDQVVLDLPLLEIGFTVSLRELQDPAALWNGQSDLAELNRASDGAVGRRLIEVFDTPLPIQTRQVVGQIVGSPLLEQALLAASALGQVDGLPVDPSGTELTVAVERATARGELTLLTLLRALPGKSVTVDLPRAVMMLQRMVAQRRQANALVEQGPAVSAAPALVRPGARPLRRSLISVPAAHRAQTLEVVVIEPERDANGRVVVISHGLWDSPENFEGWGRHLASHGYRVLLPRHPGSDNSQQQAMLTGKTAPPSPEELRLRPLDVTAVIDASGARNVVVIGHSWGATTVLQLAGTKPSTNRLRERCDDLNDPERNLSWVLQCSFLGSADRAGLADSRVRAVVAVSPPLRLLFDHGAADSMQARALLVSGNRDWVVSPDPEAVEPFRVAAANGHALVLVDGGDHFNLRSPADGDGGPLRGLLLAWTNGAFAAGAAAAPGPQARPLLPDAGWGNDEMPLVRVR
ncbi:MAG: alpha/beta fold hydrolase [Chitinophagaceae bacterium]|jgi:predicted dienelactone hydrolase|nr:alpha/beta fold hydrolase [Chitinophagaceae bacterium]